MVKVIIEMDMQTLPQLSSFRMAGFIDFFSHVFLDMEFSFFLLNDLQPEKKSGKWTPWSVQAVVAR